MFKSIRGLITGVTCLAVLGGFLISALIFNFQLKNHLIGDKEAELNRVIEALDDIAKDNYYRAPSREQMDGWATVMGRLGDYRVTIVHNDGSLYGDSLVPVNSLAEIENQRTRPEIAEAFRTGRGRSLRFSPTADTEYLYVARVLDIEGEKPLVLRVGIPVAGLNAFKNEVLGIYGLLALAGLALAVLVSFLGTRGFNKSFSEIVAAAKDFGDGNFTRRIIRLPKNELAFVGLTLNRMASKLSRQMKEGEERQNYLLAILKSMDDGVLVTDKDGQVTLMNAKFKDMFNIKGEPEGRPGEFIRVPELIDAFAKIQSGGQVEPFMMDLNTTPPRFIEAHLTRLDGEAPAPGVVAVFYDLTPRQILYQMRRDFVANISHELRTPLTAIVAATETLMDKTENNEDLKPLVEVLDRQSGRLNDLAKDVLELARLESIKPQTLAKEPVKVKTLFEEAGADLAHTGDFAARIKVSPPDDDMTVMAEKRSLSAALFNLLENALRYAERPISLSARVDGPWLYIDVADKGPGIPKEIRGRIFERFFRGEKSRIRNLGGAGLGLAIVKHVAQIHGGAATLFCPEEGGAVFTIKLPYEAA